MMGRKKIPQPKLFYDRINLNQRICKDHILRKIDQVIDFEFIYKEVRHFYGHNGNVSVPPPTILKMIVLLILYNVRSERELMETIPESNGNFLPLTYKFLVGKDIVLKVHKPNHLVSMF